ncbi:MAG: BON domain-containing protein [Chloroflexota bacterium]
MLSVQVPRVDAEEFSRCDEPEQMAGHANNPSPIQKTDGAIRDSIYHAIWKDNVLRAVEHDEIDVHVKNGTVYLSGHIVSTTSQSRITNAIGTVPDILRMKNNLVLDDKLTGEVATALAALEHTYDCKFFTGTSHGVVSINGVVPDEAVKLLAEQVAAGNPKVRGVINNAQVVGTDLSPQELPFLQPAIGETIYFSDSISTVVKQVVISPDNRRVIGMLVQGQFAVPVTENRQGKMLEKTIVVPMALIRYLTKTSGFLTSASTETTQYQDFNPSYFTKPPSDWTPPYPYCPQDVLFHIPASDVENQIMIDPDLAQLKIAAQPTSPKSPAPQTDILANWEDDGGMIVQTAEAVSLATPALKEPSVNDSLGG